MPYDINTPIILLSIPNKSLIGEKGYVSKFDDSIWLTERGYLFVKLYSRDTLFMLNERDIAACYDNCNICEARFRCLTILPSEDIECLTS